MIVLDNACSSRSREIQEDVARRGCRLRLVHLPSYAPNLNRIERFWLFMKRTVRFNKAYAKFALSKQAFADLLANLAACSKQIEILITDRFHLIGAPTGGISSM